MNATDLSQVIPAEWKTEAISFATHQALHAQWVQEVSSSAGLDKPEMAHYSKLNFQRMHRLEKTFVPSLPWSDILTAVDVPADWIILTETWCGDAAQNLPLLEKVIEGQSHIRTLYLWRDQNLELMDAFLTRGGRSIPKVIFTDRETGKVRGSWGPRPAAADAVFLELKAKHGADYTPIVTAMQQWYNQDKGQSFERDFRESLLHAYGRK